MRVVVNGDAGTLRLSDEAIHVLLHAPPVAGRSAANGETFAHDMFPDRPDARCQLVGSSRSAARLQLKAAEISDDAPWRLWNQGSAPRGDRAGVTLRAIRSVQAASSSFGSE
jgi:hypothetical protein